MVLFHPGHCTTVSVAVYPAIIIDVNTLNNIIIEHNVEQIGKGRQRRMLSSYGYRMVKGLGLSGHK